MEIQSILQYLDKYGLIAIFLIVLLEYMNMPGFPAGIIMPAAGMWAAYGKTHFLTALFISCLAGLLGSLILYGVGRLGGGAVMEKYYRKFPSHREKIESCFSKIGEKGPWYIFCGKLFPMLRTIISIPAGILKMNLVSYTISSFLGILVWNTVFIGAGYFLGERLFQILG